MKKRIVSLALVFMLCLSMIPGSYALAVDSGAISRWEDYYSTTYNVLNGIAQFGTQGIVQSDFNEVMWSCLDNSYLEVVGFYDSNERPNEPLGVSREKLQNISNNFETSYNKLLKEFSLSGSSVASAVAKAVIGQTTEFRFGVRFDDNFQQWRIWCYTASCWLVNSAGVYPYTPADTSSSDNSGGLWVKTRDITWDKVTVFPYDSLVSIRDGLIAGGRDCSLAHNGDYWVIHDPKAVETFCNSQGSPFVALWSESATDIEWDYTDAPTDQIINIDGGTVNVSGTVEYVDSIEYNTNDQSYTVNTYYYNTTNNEYIYNTYEISYHYDYTYVVNIGNTAMDQESYKYYYDLPDGRSSADLTMEDLVSLSVNFDIVTYDKAIDTGTLKYLYHFDGDMLPDSYYDAEVDLWSDNPSIQYVDSGVFGGALYLDSNRHSVTFNTSDIAYGSDIFVRFRYYYSPTQESSSVPLKVLMDDSEIFRIQGSNYYLDGSPIDQSLWDTFYDPGQWIEYGFWYDDSSSWVSLYLNGHFVYGADANIVGGSVSIEFPDNGRIFGYLDEVSIWSAYEEEFPFLGALNYIPSAVPFDSNMILVLPETEDLKVPTLAIQTGETITGYRIGGVRPSDPKRGQVWAQLENNVITSLQVYNGVAWTDCEGRVWTGSRWIPLYAFNVVTLADYFDVIGTYDNTTIYSDSGFWSWFQKAWNDFRSWLDGFKLDNQENWNTLFAYLEEEPCNHHWVFVESVYADYCDSNGHSAVTDYVGNSDGGTHQLQSVCTVCGDIVSTVSESCIDADSNGSCDSCSQKMDPCFSGHSAGNISYTSNGNGSSHTVVNACTVCGETVSSTTALCTDANEDLICDLCFQRLPDKDPCADGHTVSTSTVANNNMTNHTVIGVCSVCGEEQSRNTVNCSNDGSDHCSVCGQALTACADGHGSGVSSYISNDDKETHTVTVKCSVCQEALSTSRASCTDTGGDDLCDLCGQDLSQEVIYYPTVLKDGEIDLPYGTYRNATACYFDYATGEYYADWADQLSSYGGSGTIKKNTLIPLPDQLISGDSYSQVYSVQSDTGFDLNAWRDYDFIYLGVVTYGVTTDPALACDLPSTITGVNAPESAYSLFSLRSTLQGEWKYDLYRCSYCGEEYYDYTGEGAPEVEVSEDDDWFKVAWEEFMEIFRTREDNPDVNYDVTINQDIEIDMTVKDPDQEDGTLSIFDLLKKAIGAGTKMIDFLYQFGIKDALDNFNENMDYLTGLYVDDTVDITEQDDSVYDLPELESEDPAARDEVTIWDY